MRGFLTLLVEAGWKAYVDWSDNTLPNKPNRETARHLQAKIVDLDLFLFLATPNSMASRWCPWELGYASGKKAHDAIIVCPTAEGGTIHGNEYLELYRRLDLSSAQQLAVWQPGKTTEGVLVASL